MTVAITWANCTELYALMDAHNRDHRDTLTLSALRDWLLDHATVADALALFEADILSQWALAAFLDGVATTGAHVAVAIYAKQARVEAGLAADRLVRDYIESRRRSGIMSTPHTEGEVRPVFRREVSRILKAKPTQAAGWVGWLSKPNAVDNEIARHRKIYRDDIVYRVRLAWCLEDRR